ncbi:hypothetical protein AGABI2DRAFT_74872 [Agaricus bisporus var. bisporus H97]|uniref:hypothetical protein n=1 Tax=Agaricus bisporus var. bisporus (strain H97 / ATCC MYA-4626 / FGSC 10389) TaxID=936046 RepID=UPI00029F5776|nr:hypothetical protein AGABI2DRAFT_74872 [Agaricus bisporus var. bisporus H97]EKV44594.1 hypothetical protein AGABI2DRAFT_74872 [Agaricus bisporus var. bisporus H97]
MNCTPKGQKFVFRTLRILSFNVGRSWETTTSVLGQYANHYDIILFQEPGWKGVCKQPSIQNPEGDMAYGPPLSESWTPHTSAFDPTKNIMEPVDERPRVLTYTHKRLDIFNLKLRTDIIKHRDISLVTLYIKQGDHTKTVDIMNVYNDGRTHDAVAALESLDERIPLVNICAGDFNIHNQTWNENAAHLDPTIWGDHLKDVMSDMGMEYTIPDNPEQPTRAPCTRRNNDTETDVPPSIIDLVFTSEDISLSELFKLHVCENDADCLSSDHFPIQITILFSKDDVVYYVTRLDLESEEDYEGEIRDKLGNLADECDSINSREELVEVVEEISRIFEKAWSNWTEEAKVTGKGKSWWNKECTRAFNDLRDEQNPKGGKKDMEKYSDFRRVVKNAKKMSYEKKIHEIVSTRGCPWDLMPWARERKMPATESLLDDQGIACVDKEHLFQMLHMAYNSANNRPVNLDCMLQ